MLTVDEGTKAYVAGVLDMMGIIRVRPTTAGVLPYVGLSTTNKKIVDFLAGLTDTKVTTTKRNYVKGGCAEHCKRKHQHVVSQSYRWSVSGVKATVLLANIKPYLVFKTTEAEMALIAGKNAGFKPATYTKMRYLGWEIPPTLQGSAPTSEKDE